MLRVSSKAGAGHSDQGSLSNLFSLGGTRREVQEGRKAALDRAERLRLAHLRCGGSGKGTLSVAASQ